MNSVFLFGNELMTSSLADLVKRHLQKMHPNLVIKIETENIVEDSISDALAQVDQILAEYPLYVVVLMGTADAIQQIPIEVFTSNLQYLINKIKSYRLVLTTIPFVDESRQHVQKNQQFLEYNQVIRHLAKKEGLSMVDLDYAMTVYPAATVFLQEDGIHLSELGEDLYAALIARNITNIEGDLAKAAKQL
jgi:lysophospholipase L1-like esterase